MTLADRIRESFAPLGATAQAALTQVAEVEKGLERMPPAQCDALLLGLGFEITQKHEAAQTIATAHEIMMTVGPMIAAFL